MIPNIGYDNQQEVDSGRVVFPVGGEDGTSDSERTVSFGGISCDGHGDVMEVDSGYCNPGDPDARSNAVVSMLLVLIFFKSNTVAVPLNFVLVFLLQTLCIYVSLVSAEK